MTYKIFKYPLQTTDEQTIEMPLGAEILSVQAQNNRPCIWALVDPNAKLVERRFRIYGTGHSIEIISIKIAGTANAYMADKKYIGTYQLNGGALVWHVFEIM